MRKVFLGICIFLSLAGCAEKKSLGKYPVIDIANGIGEYQKAYCSDFFSSIELIPLETDKNSLIGEQPVVLLHDNLIFVYSTVQQQTIPPVRNLFVFDRSGKFLNQIGQTGNGPGEYFTIHNIFLNHDGSTIYVEDYANILEYEFSGKFIRSFRIPNVDGGKLSGCAGAGNNLFVGQLNYDGKRKHKYYLFNQNGDTVKCFPSHIFYDRSGNGAFESALFPVRVDKQLYLKDYVNDTLYVLTNDSNLQPAFVFDFGKYSIPVEWLSHGRDTRDTYIFISGIAETPDYIFYQLYVPQILPRPKSKPVFMSGGRERSTDAVVYGVYNIKRNTNMFFDTDQHLQKGIVNDLDGGLSFIPGYYAGNGVMVDFWKAEDMKEMLTEEYFAAQNIKDRQAHQKLRELLKKLNDEDNGVVVIAKMK